ncbi:MAG: substrate-binding domain-containing protein [Candidatus Thermoplasmatota archaeon]|nr:substrate-binding domain-containing protein [Candidatus Thermoplasmatota archaeon]
MMPLVWIRKNKKSRMIMMGLIIIVTFCSTLFSGCLQNHAGFSIVIIGRDSTSGTREFFWQHVMGKEDFSIMLQERNSNGGVYLTVTQTPGAIGYVSLGYVDNGVKALKINNITANISNILTGKYPIARDLLMFTKGNATGVVKEFIEYIQSTEGQVVVEEEGFVPLPTNISYNSSGKHLSGTLSISGSTTVFPIAEKAKDAFVRLYPDISITVSSTGSGAGIVAVAQETVDIGMSSRDLKLSEGNLGLVKYVIAKDGIAIIVNPENTFVDSLTMEQLKAIYKGEIKNWEDLDKIIGVVAT